MITIFILSLAVTFLSLQNYFLHRDFIELRHDVNDLTTRFISYKIISSHKIEYLLGNNNFLDNIYDESGKEN